MIPHEKLMRVVGNAKGDDLERAQRAFAGEAMHEEYSNGRTRGQILAEYQAQRAEWQAAYDLAAAVPELLAACETALLALRELARYAGDGPEWNEGGWAWEACQSLREAITKARPAP